MATARIPEDGRAGRSGDDAPSRRPPDRRERELDERERDVERRERRASEHEERSGKPPLLAPPEPASAKRSLSDLLSETRVLLPGTQVLLAFLMTMPFYDRFADLGTAEHVVYLVAFFSTMIALALLAFPAAYHRIARPIHHKVRFKVLATRFVVAGLVPLSVALTLIAYLVTSMVVAQAAIWGAIGMAALLATVWWALPLLRIHDRHPKDVEP